MSNKDKKPAKSGIVSNPWNLRKGKVRRFGFCAALLQKAVNELTIEYSKSSLKYYVVCSTY